MPSDCPFHERYNYWMGLIEKTGGEMNKILSWTKLQLEQHTQEGVEVVVRQTLLGKLRRICAVPVGDTQPARWERLGVKGNPPNTWPKRHNRGLRFGTDFYPSPHPNLRLSLSGLIIIKSPTPAPSRPNSDCNSFRHASQHSAFGVTAFTCTHSICRAEMHTWPLPQCYVFLTCVCVYMYMHTHIHTHTYFYPCICFIHKYFLNTYYVQYYNQNRK